MKKSNLPGFLTLVLALLVSAASPAAAQEQPTTPCPSSPTEVTPWPPGPEPRLAEVAVQGAVLLINCGYPKGCIRFPIEKGATDIVDQQQGKWTCGGLADRNGSAPGWIRTDALRQVTFDLHPPVGAWVGNWAGGGDRVTIRRTQSQNILLVVGHARWGGGVEFPDQFGFMRGNASPSGNRLLISDHLTYGCTVYMTLMSRYIITFDNGGCGGINVHFLGVWRRIGH